jgi:uncharacterized protein DUF4154
MMRALLLATLCTSAGVALPHAQEISQEYQIKAAYLYNFLKYVEWPNSINRTFLICVAGQNPFGSVLDGLTKNERVRGNPVKTELILGPETGCDVIFTPRTSNIPAYLQDAAGRPILTVGETPRFIEQGGIVNFFLENGKVRFEINRSAAERAGLRISSRLLQLAKIVDPETEER